MDDVRADEHRQPLARQDSAVVSSCESDTASESDDGIDYYNSDDIDSHDGHEAMKGNFGIGAMTKQNDNDTTFYDENADNEDEAYVYKNLRGGVKENVRVRQKVDGGSDLSTMIQVYKPRNSDAVLSCPCCFKLVCMDCQRHEKYSNQYRAMFVMNIVVDWSKKLIYDTDAKALVVLGDFATSGIGTSGECKDEQVYYYQVSCDGCHTNVAALDMVEEVYHFYDCMST